jgi:hypothetical protein
MTPTNLSRLAVIALAAGFSFSTAPAIATDHMSMPMSDKPAHFKPTVSAYTGNHQFLVKITDLPNPIPYQKYFTLHFAVYDGHHPDKQLSDGMKNGLAHGMQSSPKIGENAGAITADGMYFHMMGKWTLKATVKEGGKQGVAYFDLPCCGK